MTVSPMKVFLFFFLIALGVECIAQDTLDYRPKLVELSLESHSGYNATPKPSQNMDNLTRVKQDMALKMRVGIPVILNAKTTFAVQLKFDQQYYTTENSTNDLFNYLNSHQLTNTGLTLYYQRKLTEGRSLTFATQTELASDRWELNGNSGRYLVNGNYMKDLNSKTSIGFGGVVNYALGLWNIYPTFSYKKKLSNRTLFEVFLPSKVGYRYHLNPKTYFIAETEFVNWRFNVTDPLDNNSGDMALIRSDVYFKFRLEKEIHDWLWLGVDTGFIHNINYGLTEHGTRISDAVQEFNVKDSAFLRFWIFILPPNKLWKSL
ncbi:MAG: hypothetical protein ACJAZV_000949 [Roseivirga sp.]|jgi:hypothetical protein